MLNNIKISRYVKKNSIVDKMNTTSKLVSLLLFLTISSISYNIYIHTLLLFIIVILMLVSKISIIEYLKSIRYIVYLIIGIFVINIILKEEIIFIFLNIIKIIELVLYTSLITLTTSESELVYGLNNILKPLNIFKIRTNRIAFILSLSIRFIPLVIDQLNRIIKSLSSKGIEFKKTKLRNKILILKSIIIPIINLSLKKADELAESMEIRLYDVNKERTNYKYNKWTFLDSIIQILFIFILIIEVII